jgi:hypothetical protein
LAASTLKPDIPAPLEKRGLTRNLFGGDQFLSDGDDLHGRLLKMMLKLLQD